MQELPESTGTRRNWLLMLPLLLLVGWFAYRFFFPPFVPPRVPVPNGYDELVELTGRLARRTGFYREMGNEELAAIVAVNEPILAKAREALRKESVVPIDWDGDQQWFNNVHLQQNVKLRELARAFAAEGRWAQQQGDTRHAVSCGLDALQLVAVASRGGLGVDYLVGMGISYGGLYWLREACETATWDDCKFLLNNLPDVHEQMEDPAELTERERVYVRQVNGVYHSFVTTYLFSANRAEFEERLRESLRNVHARTELLRLHYAIRAFQLAEGRWPRALDELTGRELKEIPKDPFGSVFVYQPGKDRYLLYSVGPNGLDDGGIENEKDPSSGDIFLEPEDSSQSGTPPAN